LQQAERPKDVDAADKAYADILAALESVEWHLSQGKVTPISPIGHKEVNFFPGQRGFSGPKFPVGGVMMVGNNFASLAGWLRYSANLDYHDTTTTWNRLNGLILPATEVCLEEFWFTNFSLGVMDVDSETYTFPPKSRKDLKFKTVFEKFVVAMRPRLIVALGGDVASYIKADYAGRQTDRAPDVRLCYGHPTVAMLHPAAWHTPREQFIAEGHRIRDLSRKYEAN
jgi:hypothetical protein